MAVLISFALNSEVSIVTFTSKWQTLLLGMIQDITIVARAALVVPSSFAHRKNEVAIVTFAPPEPALFLFEGESIVAMAAFVIISPIFLSRECAIETRSSKRAALLALQVITRVAAAALVICSSFADRIHGFAIAAITFELLAFFVIELIAWVARAAMVVLCSFTLGNKFAIGTYAPVCSALVVHQNISLVAAFALVTLSFLFLGESGAVSASASIQRCTSVARSAGVFTCCHYVKH